MISSENLALTRDTDNNEAEEINGKGKTMQGKRKQINRLIIFSSYFTARHTRTS